MSAWTLHHGDCLDPVTGLASLPDRSVDHVICDPPYSEHVHAMSRTGSSRARDPDRDGAGRGIHGRSKDLGFASLSESVRADVADHAARVARRWALVLELVAWLANEPHSDTPGCACPVIGAFVRAWNDGMPRADRARILTPFLSRIVGSRSTPAIEEQRSYMALDWLIRVYTPAWLDLRDDLRAHAETLRGLAPIVDMRTAGASAPVRAARDALCPTLAALQVSAAALLDRMLALSEVAS